MSNLVITGNSIDSSNSFVEIDSENSCNNTLSSHEDDTKPIIESESLSPQLSTISFKTHSINSNNSAAMGGISIPHHGLSAAFHGYHSNVNNNSKSPPFLLPAQLYKSLFASAVLQNPEKINGCSGTPPFPRNLLFSCSEKSPNSDTELEEKCSIGDEVNFNFC